MKVLFRLLTVPARRLLPRFSMATRSRIIAMVGSKHRRKMSRTTWRWEKLNQGCNFLGMFFGNQRSWKVFFKCSKLKGNTFDKKPDVIVTSYWHFVLACTFRTVAHQIHHSLNLEVVNSKENWPVYPTSMIQGSLSSYQPKQGTVRWEIPQNLHIFASSLILPQNGFHLMIPVIWVFPKIGVVPNHPF